MKALEIGTKVRVKTDLVDGEQYEHHNGEMNYFTTGMEDHKGKTFLVQHDSGYGYILTGAGSYFYTDEMLEVVEYPNGLKYREGDYLLNLASLDLVKVVKAVNERRNHNYALEYVNPRTHINQSEGLVNGKYLWTGYVIEDSFKLVPEPDYKVGQKVSLEVDGTNKNGKIVAVHYNDNYEKYDYSIDCVDGNSYYVYSMHDYKITSTGVIDIIPSKLPKIDIRHLYPSPSISININVVDYLNAKLDEYQKELDEIYKKQSDLLVEERKLLDRENDINKILSAIQTTIDEFQEQ